MRLWDGRIRENREENSGHAYRMIIQAPRPLQALPGQFLQLSAWPASTDPLLRRPLSIAGLSGDRVTVIYQVRGKGTLALSRLRSGDAVSVLGPLGNGFPATDGPAILLAGGLGAAGLLFLAETLSASGRAAGTAVILGCRTKGSLLLPEDFRTLGLTVRCATEDGTAGFKGTAVSLLKADIGRGRTSGVVYACGPNPMLAAAAGIAARNRWPAFVSLETVMACGTGICRGCAVPTGKGYRLACVDGPVFPAEEILWDEYVQPTQKKSEFCRN